MSPSPPALSQRERELEAPDYRTFDLRGSHAHAGYVLGQADPPFATQFWWSAPPPLRFADACRDVVHDIHPHLTDELRAYADVQRLNARELWQMCCRVNLKAKVRPSEVGLLQGVRLLDGATEGCSTFVWFVPAPSPPWGEGRGEGGVVVGRNYDYLPQQVRRQRIRFAPDCCANASIGARGGVPCGRYDGLNEHGVFFSLHVVMTDTPAEDEVRPGVPFHLVGRMVLELCHSAREAANLLTRIPHLSSLNYMVADAQDAFVIEADPRRVRVIERDGAVLAATNHFRHPDMTSLQGGRAFTNSECRLAFLQRQGKPRDRKDKGDKETRTDSLASLSSSSALSVEQSVNQLLDHAEAVMADRTAPVCGLSGSLTTLWSCVAELTTRRIRYAAGAPGVVKHEEMTEWYSRL